MNAVQRSDVRLYGKQHLLKLKEDIVALADASEGINREHLENLLAPYTTDYVKKDKKVAYPTPEDMPIGWIASRDVSAFVVEAFDKPELSGQSFMVSGLDNLKGNDLAEKFSIGLGEKIDFYAMPPKEFGDILSKFVGESAARCTVVL